MRYFYLFIIILLFLFIGLRIILFLITPLIKKFKLVRVYNPLFFIREKRNCIEIHLGFARDLIFFDSISRKKILTYLASGLIQFIEDLETQKVNTKKVIQGNPYFLKTTSFSEFGFLERKLNFIEKLRFVLNYLELCFLNSIMKKKPVLVKIDRLRIVFTNAQNLIRYKEKIQLVYLQLTKNYHSDFKFVNTSNFVSKAVV